MRGRVLSSDKQETPSAAAPVVLVRCPLSAASSVPFLTAARCLLWISVSVDESRSLVRVDRS